MFCDSNFLGFPNWNEKLPNSADLSLCKCSAASSGMGKTELIAKKWKLCYNTLAKACMMKSCVFC